MTLDFGTVSDRLKMPKLYIQRYKHQHALLCLMRTEQSCNLKSVYKAEQAGLYFKPVFFLFFSRTLLSSFCNFNQILPVAENPSGMQTEGRLQYSLSVCLYQTQAQVDLSNFSHDHATQTSIARTHTLP